MHNTVGEKMAERRGGRIPAAAWLVAAMLAPAGGALAGEPAISTSDNPSAGAVFETSSATLPRFDNFDGSRRPQQRLDMALLSPGRSAVGVTLGITGLAPTRYGFSGVAPDTTAGVTLGLQWRYTLDNNRRIDVTAWRDLGLANDALALAQSRDTAYGARVEMQLFDRRSRLVAEHGFLGMQLDGGARIGLRRNAGKPMVYYRSNF